MNADSQLLPVRATFVKNLDGFRGDARLYRLSEPIKIGWEPWDGEEDTRVLSQYVVVSAVVADFSGPETYIFGGNAEGEVIDYGELPGSFRGSMDHAEAIRGAGWVLD